MSQPEMAELPQEQARRARILEGATAVFLAYGFQRTTMEDIARAAEISRPALYLEFRNKTDIYRALASEFLQRFLAVTNGALAGDGPLAERLERAVKSTLDLVLEIENTAHGAEIIDMKGSLAADIVADGRSRMQDMFGAVIGREAERAGKPQDLAEAIAAMILDALDGLRLRNPEVAEQKAAIRLYIRIALSALER